MKQHLKYIGLDVHKERNGVRSAISTRKGRRELPSCEEIVGTIVASGRDRG